MTLPLITLGVFALGVVCAVVSAVDFAKTRDEDPHQRADGDWPFEPRTFVDTTITNLQVPVEGTSSPFNGTAPAGVFADAGRGSLDTSHGEAV